MNGRNAFVILAALASLPVLAQDEAGATGPGESPSNTNFEEPTARRCDDEMRWEPNTYFLPRGQRIEIDNARERPATPALSCRPGAGSDEAG